MIYVYIADCTCQRWILIYESHSLNARAKTIDVSSNQEYLSRLFSSPIQDVRRVTPQHP